MQGRRGQISGVLTAVFVLVAGLLSTVVSVPAQAVGEDSGGVFVPVTPFRAGDETLVAGQTRTFQVTGTGGIPSTGVSSVVVDIAATTTTATTSSYVTLWPAGETRPSIGSMFYTKANGPRSNTAIVKVSAAGKINLYNYAGSTRLYLDVQGYFTTGSDDGSAGGFVPVTPIRVARSDIGQGMAAGKVAVGGIRDVQVTNGEEIPADATAVFANIEVRDATADGALIIAPGGTSTGGKPASMNYSDDGVYTSGMTVKLSGDGKLRIDNYIGSAVNIKVDIQGYFSADPTQGGSFTPLMPANAYSTGWTGETELAGGETRTVKLTGQAGVPDDDTAGAVALTATARNWTTGGTITLWNADEEDWPGTTNVAFLAGQGVPSNGISSTAIVELSIDGEINIRNSSAQTVGLTLTTQGWFTSAVEIDEVDESIDSEDDLQFFESNDEVVQDILNLQVGVTEAEAMDSIAEIALESEASTASAKNAVLEQLLESESESAEPMSIASGGGGLVKLTTPRRTGDIFYSPSTSRKFVHGHSGIFSSKTTIIEAPGGKVNVREIRFSQINVRKGAKLQEVKVSNKVLSSSKRKAVVAWARSRRGDTYNNSFVSNTRIVSGAAGTSGSKQNCSQLVYAAFRKKTDVNLNHIELRPIAMMVADKLAVYPWEIRDSKYTDTYKTL